MLAIAEHADAALPDEAEVLVTCLAGCVSPGYLMSTELAGCILTRQDAAETVIGWLRAEAKDVKFTADANALLMANDGNALGMLCWALARELAATLKEVRYQAAKFNAEIDEL
jgi:hypothetical protein